MPAKPAFNPNTVEWMAAQLSELENLCAEAAFRIRHFQIKPAKMPTLFPLVKAAVDPVVGMARAAGLEIFESDWRPKTPRVPKTLKFPTSA